jgi:carbamoyltransferase
VQQALEIAIRKILTVLIREHGIRDFCFAGGVALNCTANAQVIRDLEIRSHIHPAAGDAGGAMGAALQLPMRSRECGPIHRYRFSPYLGIRYPEPVIKATLSVKSNPVSPKRRHRR